MDNIKSLFNRIQQHDENGNSFLLFDNITDEASSSSSVDNDSVDKIAENIADSMIKIIESQLSETSSKK